MSQYARSTGAASAALLHFRKQPAAHQVCGLRCLSSCAGDVSAAAHTNRAALLTVRMRLATSNPCQSLAYPSQDFRALKVRGYKPAWYPDVLHTESGAALWLNADGSLARWQQVSTA